MRRTHKNHKMPWHAVDRQVGGLATGVHHNLIVKREAIPLIFVPGIMGTRLCRKGTNGVGDDSEGLPNMRWDPNHGIWMFKKYSGASGGRRRMMLVGPDIFDPDFLEPCGDETPDKGDGRESLWDTYYGFLDALKDRQRWGPLTKIFEFPVFAFGYNWTDCNDANGARLAKRIDQVIAESRKVTGSCKKVIIITHSMGGLVARAASELHCASGKILGIVHGVQPVTGAPAAYWRVKAGFEGSTNMGMTQRCLGNSGPTVTPVLGNIPGGLELLPSRYFDGSKPWLFVRRGKKVTRLPKSSPYTEIYRVPATGSEIDHPQRKFWGLIDPDLLNPQKTAGSATADHEDAYLMCKASPSPWEEYLAILEQAERFTETLKIKCHTNTYTFHGERDTTASRIDFDIDSYWIEKKSYPTQGFRGYFKTSSGEKMRATLQDPSGDGDGTVPVSSGTALSGVAVMHPPPRSIGHDTAYKKSHRNVMDFVVRAVSTLCEKRYREMR